MFMSKYFDLETKRISITQMTLLLHGNTFMSCRGASSEGTLTRPVA